MILIMLFLFMSVGVSAPNIDSIEYPEQSRIEDDPFVVLWDHIKWVETRDRDLINHDEKAYGRGQITPIKLKEYNKKTGSNYSSEDCLNESVSKEIFLWHYDQYASHELAAKRWNGSGPMTILYWNKVEVLPLMEFRLRMYKLNI